MKRDQILAVLRSLAMSQGFYGRLLNAINQASEEEQDEFFTNLEAQDFQSSVDLVIYLES